MRLEQLVGVSDGPSSEQSSRPALVVLSRWTRVGVWLTSGRLAHRRGKPEHDLGGDAAGEMRECW
jgi:hypothetical protein